MSETFNAGDLVTDREKDLNHDEVAESVAMVLYKRAVPAEDAGISANDAMETVADVNPEYPSDDDVYRVAFIPSLDKDAPGWRQWDGEAARERDNGHGFRHEVIETQHEFGIALDTYDYPASRLYRWGQLCLPQSDDVAKAIRSAIDQ